MNFKILVDPEINIIDRQLRHDWFTILSVTQLATLVAKYFCPSGLGECTLAESLAEFPSTTRSPTTIMRMPHSFVTMNLWATMRGKHAELIQILEVPS